MIKKVTIELSEAQAKIVLTAVEEWFRLRMGQYYQTADSLAFLGYKRDEAHPAEFDERILKRNHIQAVLKAIMEIVFPLNCYPHKIDPEVHIASDIWSVLRWTMCDRKDWINTPYQMGTEPMPTITVEVQE